MYPDFLLVDFVVCEIESLVHVPEAHHWNIDVYKALVGCLGLLRTFFPGLCDQRI
jgi:hypothetical protein